MGICLASVVVFTAALAGAGPPKTSSPTFESQADLLPQGKIDKFVFGSLRRLSIRPANLCSDAVFVRRVYLDVIGTLPTADEAGVSRDHDPDKRPALVDRLLERKEFADYWAMKWSDLLRIKAEFPINLWPNAAQAYHRWIRTCIKENMPYDRFVRELLTASGSNFRVPPVNFYRAVQSREPQAIAQAVALSFMGSAGRELAQGAAGRAWRPSSPRSATSPPTNGRRRSSSSIPSKPPGLPAGRRRPFFPTARRPSFRPTQIRARCSPIGSLRRKNPWFARNIVNRIWSWLLGAASFTSRTTSAPTTRRSNPELLAYLEQELVAAHYDLKHVYRLILNSKTYQLSSIPRSRPIPTGRRPISPIIRCGGWRRRC